MFRTMTMGLGAAAILLCSPAWAKDLRIGVVNMERAVRETDEGKAAESTLLNKKKKLENELNRKLKEFYEKEEQLRKAWSILKDAEKQKRAAESRQQFEALQKRYLEAERDLMEDKTKAMMKISNKINKVIQVLAQREKYDYIFNNAAVMWAPPHVDLTNEVIRSLNRK
jgi:outer membrane protein